MSHKYPKIKYRIGNIRVRRSSETKERGEQKYGLKIKISFGAGAGKSETREGKKSNPKKCILPSSNCKTQKLYHVVLSQIIPFLQQHFQMILELRCSLLIRLKI